MFTDLHHDPPPRYTRLPFPHTCPCYSFLHSTHLSISDVFSSDHDPCRVRVRLMTSEVSIRSARYPVSCYACESPFLRLRSLPHPSPPFRRPSPSGPGEVEPEPPRPRRPSSMDIGHQHDPRNFVNDDMLQNILTQLYVSDLLYRHTRSNENVKPR